MNNDFREAKFRFKRCVSEILRADGPTAEHKEAALPSYAHRNPVIDYLFWRRVSIACDLIQRHGGSTVLDFGCGIGFASYVLARRGMRVTAADLTLTPWRRVRGVIEFPPDLRFHEGPLDELPSPDASFDTILALDVLEHIEDLDRLCERFLRLLRPGGLVVVSGPTENLFYRLGRRLAGPDFTGEYHVSHVGHVRDAMSRYFEIRTAARLIWPVTLFELFTAAPRRGAA